MITEMLMTSTRNVERQPKSFEDCLFCAILHGGDCFSRSVKDVWL